MCLSGTAIQHLMSEHDRRACSSGSSRGPGRIDGGGGFCALNCGVFARDRVEALLESIG